MEDCQLRKLAAIFLCKLTHENLQAQESICEALDFDLVYSSDGVARVCLNKIPQNLQNLLRKKEGQSLKVILD